jgi:hypothetical protein
MNTTRHLSIVLCLAAFSATALAQNLHNLERGLPLEIEDTLATDPGQFQLQAFVRYDHTRENQDQTTLQPQIQYGLAEGLHVQAQSSFLVGDADRTGSGDLQLGLLYNFLKEPPSGPLPSLAVTALVVAPTGVGSDGLDTELSLIATKSLTAAPSEDRIHLNLRWYHNSVPAHDERHDRFTFVAGYSRKLAQNTILVADFVRDQQLEEGQDSNIVEIGLLQQLTPQVTVGFGLGAGIGDDSPHFRALFSLQVGLGS